MMFDMLNYRSCLKKVNRIGIILKNYLFFTHSSLPQNCLLISTASMP